jgi:hypothetical protein
VESGTHSDLLAAAGEYASLWRRQTRGEGAVVPRVSADA